ncbi:MAG: DUF1059 domain-containing protein [Thermoplasmataceae archaeon]|jgi:predicted small metal-binding protein|nr:DUF1059 domain-containing protein [Candidatus Thermoplasmatota archaeon]
MSRFYFKCSDIGYQCSFETNAATEKDILPKIKMHHKYAHGFKEIPDDVMEKITGAIHEQ